MSNCLEHPKDLFGETDMKKVAEAIVSLHYKSLSDLFYYLPIAFDSASTIDYSIGKNALGYNQAEIASCLKNAKPFAERLWDLSKPFMESGSIKEKDL